MFKLAFSNITACRTALSSVSFKTTTFLPIRRSSTDNDDKSQKDAPDFEMSNPYQKEKKQCILCKYGIKLNYKNTRLLAQFTSSFTGRPYDKHITGLCDAQQKVLKEQLKLAQQLSLMPYLHKDVRYMQDPPLFDPFKPSRPHPY